MSPITYLLGFLGLLQAILLPGLCLTASLRGWNWLQRVLIAPPLSLLINYYLVWLLVSVGAYGPNTMLAITALEAAWILYRAKAAKPLLVAYPPLQRPSEFILLILGVIALTKYAQAWVRNFGDVFQMWDAVVSWNAWGRHWFEGSVPLTGLYPHALPITFSLPYAFMKTAEIEAFSKASLGIAYLFGLGALLELGFRRKDLRSLAWICTFVYSGIQARFLQSHWNSGYADVPLALTLLFAFCVSFMEGKDTPKIFGLIAGTAPLVKQPGLLFAALSPVLSSNRKGIRSAFWPTALFAALAAGPWYLFISTSILRGRGGHNTIFLANLVPGGLLERWSVTLPLILHFAGPAYLVGWLVFATLGSVVSKEARRWWLYLGLPYLLIWSIFFAYDIRNLSMALFPLAVAVSAGIAFLIRHLEETLPLLTRGIHAQNFLAQPRHLGRFVIALTILLALISLNRPIRNWQNHGGPLAWEQEQRLYLGDAPKANKAYLDLANCQTEKNIQFISNYWWPDAIPALKAFTKLVDCERIAQAIKKREKAYVYLHVATCNVQPNPSLMAYEESGHKIFATNPELKTSCAAK